MPFSVSIGRYAAEGTFVLAPTGAAFHSNVEWNCEPAPPVRRPAQATFVCGDLGEPADPYHRFPAEYNQVRMYVNLRDPVDSTTWSAKNSARERQCYSQYGATHQLETRCGEGYSTDEVDGRVRVVPIQRERLQ